MSELEHKKHPKYCNWCKKLDIYDTANLSIARYCLKYNYPVKFAVNRCRKENGKVL